MLASLGYGYEDAKRLKSWLFWLLYDESQTNKSREKAYGWFDMYEAIGAAGGGFVDASRKEILDKRHLELSLLASDEPVGGGGDDGEFVEDEPSPQAGMSIDERKALWGSEW